MYNITLIGTIHSENGKCNSDELHRILEEINPEVIFDELSSSSFDRYYSDSFELNYANSILLNRHPPIVPLEVKCIKKYKQNYKVKMFPVDSDVRQTVLNDEILFMTRTFWENEDYKKLNDENDSLIAQEGFYYLNSHKFLDFLEKKEGMEKDIIESDSQKNRLMDSYKLFHAEQYDNRENAMLENIYKYSRGNQFHQAVFLIGAQHRKSIMQKIAAYEKQSEIKLNWTMYGNK